MLRIITPRQEQCGLSKPNKIFLIGPMGAGKSTIGRMLSEQLQTPFIDMDEVIVERAGRSIPEIFKEDGEPAFRAIESAVLGELCASTEGGIVATGGGAVLSSGNRERMQASGRVVWLDVSPEAAARRIAGDTNRPLLHGVDALEKARQLDGERRPLYISIADVHVETDQSTPKQCVDLILKEIEL